MIAITYQTTGARKLDSITSLEDFLASVEKRAFRMAVIATSSREDALDIVQDAMYKLVHRYSKRRHDEWGPLFHRIMQSTIRDWYRRSKVRKGFLTLFGHSDEEDASFDLAAARHERPDGKLTSEQQIAALDKALHSLPLRQQQAFLLRQWEGLNVKQTAQAMQCSEGSVKTHYSRAVQALRKQLEEHWP